MIKPNFIIAVGGSMVPDMKKIEQLKQSVIESNNILPYINLNEKNEYKGWVTDFHIQFLDGSKMELNLTKEEDLFLLFVLAVAWSRTGRWENAAYFVTYLKYNQLDHISDWMNLEKVEKLKKDRYVEVNRLTDYCVGIEPRIKISFRKDIYDSIVVLANNWKSIKAVLEESNKQGDYVKFIQFIRNLKGLGVNDKKMNIKILLILRELRCQRVYCNIPGELCCVPDERVKKACENLAIKLPATTSTRGLIKASKTLYDYFGDQYDIPPFAYEDLMSC